MMGPRPMNMGYGGGMPFGGGMPVWSPGQMPIPPQPSAPPVKNYGPVGDMLGSAQNQVNPQQPQIQTQTVPPMTSQIPAGYSTPRAIACGPTTGMGGGAMGGGRGKGRMGPGTSGGFSGGMSPSWGMSPQAPQAMGGDPYLMGGNPNTGNQVRAGYQGGPQTVPYQKQATDNYDGFYSVPYAYDPNVAPEDYGKIGAGNLGASAGFL